MTDPSTNEGLPELGNSASGEPPAASNPNGPFGRSVNKVEAWFQSSNFLGWLGILSFILALFASIPIVMSMFSAEISNVTTLVLTAVVTLLIVVSIWAAVELRRNHQLTADRERLDQLYDLRLKQYNTAERSLKADLDMKEELISLRNSKDQHTAGVFRDIARRRALHSTTLYALQSAILSTPDINDSTFQTAWDRQRAFLDEYCAFASRLFTGIKGAQCCVNIKVIWNSNVWSNLGDLRHTEFGVDSSVVPAEDISYQTIARCQVSRNDGRVVGDQDTANPISQNYIFDRMYRRMIRYFISNDIMNDIADWKELVARGAIGDFKFPDKETDQAYERLISVPIAVEGQRDNMGVFSGDKISRVIGFISIDAKDIKVKFDTTSDLAIVWQISFDLASSFFEYFRCVKHLEARRGHF